MTTAITCSDLTYSWPDGTPLLYGLDLEVPAGRTGLVGANGSGKSTLLRLLAGELRPTAGTVRVRGDLGYLPQDLTLAADRCVDDVLGVAATRRALHAIESGDVAEEHFTAVGHDWDVEERARATLGRLGLGGVGLDRRVGQLSGGETVLLGLAALLLRGPDLLLLDEPTNNLDRSARRRLYDAVTGFAGTLVVVSHDRSLLRLVETVAELRDGRVRLFGGDVDAYEQAVRVEQDAARRRVRAAESDLRRQRRERAEAEVRLARGARYGRSQRDSMPKILAGARQRRAQETAGRTRDVHDDRLEGARNRLAEAEQAVRDDAAILVDLPGTEVPAGRDVLLLSDVVLRDGVPRSLHLRGPERVGLVGRNGAGKTTLLETVAGRRAAGSGTVQVRVPVAYLPQRLDILDERLSVVDNVRHRAPAAAPHEVRARLARFLFRGAAADQAVSTLSGGERFRATLAALLLADPPPQLLVLDEPTNNLDLASVQRLTEALEGYRGALLVVSHDEAFLEGLGLTRVIDLDVAAPG